MTRRPPARRRERHSPPWLRATSRAMVRPKPTPAVSSVADFVEAEEGPGTRPRSARADAGPIVIDGDFRPMSAADGLEPRLGAVA